ncbi:conserved domain protein [Streptococcus mitis bv. 2 str. SK95]|uniref:Conserved domain protein n=1 Tax=Streptococcus mitis bv. 2 str. SK95 TaxID=1000588 RepID=F9LW05_STROR|nr:conserved domain protein [Streptococcus mitis bv. 2 str. SK95]
MSKESPLSHHEQLRYDYLFKNIHYLNDREKREFDYLKRKMDGGFPSNEVEREKI